MNRREICLALSVLPLLLATRVRAQPAGMLHLAWVSTDRGNVPSPFLDALRSGLRELGYFEGRNLVVDTWWGEGSTDSLAQSAGDIVRANPQIIVSQGAAFGALRRAGVKVPIVFTMSANPVVAGYVDSFARPGGNATGMTLFDLEPLGKRMDLLRELRPGIKRVAIVANPGHPGEAMERRVAETVSAQSGLQTRYFPVRTDEELERAFVDMASAKDEAIAALADAYTMSAAGRIAAFCRRQRIPAVSGWALFAERGNVLTYGPVIVECYRRLASYVDRIHRGAKPGDLPIEFPTKLELVINQKAAKDIGLAVPQSLLLRADEVIR
jgi:putative ABC transport system substrate-binding protein